MIFLPMLVKGPAPDSGVQDVPLSAPVAPAEGQFETRELPLVAPGAPAGGAVGMPAAQPETGVASAVEPPANGLPAATAAGNYAVNFGAYGSEADADAAVALSLVLVVVAAVVVLAMGGARFSHGPFEAEGRQ